MQREDRSFGVTRKGLLNSASMSEETRAIARGPNVFLYVPLSQHHTELLQTNTVTLPQTASAMTSHRTDSGSDGLDAGPALKNSSYLRAPVSLVFGPMAVR